MRKREFKITIEEDYFYRSYLDVMNGIFKLTDKEKDILSWFMEREFFYNIKHINRSVFDKTNRKIAATHLDISPHYLNNYIKSLKDKGMISKSKNGLQVNQNVYIDRNNGGAQIQFEIKALEG